MDYSIESGRIENAMYKTTIASPRKEKEIKMEELSNEIRAVISEPTMDITKYLRETAKKWACYVLNDNEGKALELGLKISQSICDYVNELESEV